MNSYSQNSIRLVLACGAALLGINNCTQPPQTVAPAGSSSGSNDGGSSGAGSGGTGGTLTTAESHECSTDSDCHKKLPQTNPPECAVAICNSLLSTCHFIAKDADGDGHLAQTCAAIGGGKIEMGDDCDDNEFNRHPGLWDGFGNCNNLDDDCNDLVDDGVVNGASCECDPMNPQSTACAHTPNNAKIEGLTASTNGKGACKFGTRICDANGKAGPCEGAVGPDPELCNGKDDNCNGQTDDGFEWNSIPIGQACVTGIGSCKTPGIVACQGSSFGICASPNPILPDDSSWHIVKKNGSWDWNCNNQIDFQYKLEGSTNCAANSYDAYDVCATLMAAGQAACIGMHWLGCGPNTSCGDEVVGVECPYANGKCKAVEAGARIGIFKPPAHVKQACK